MWNQAATATMAHQQADRSRQVSAQAPVYASHTVMVSQALPITPGSHTPKLRQALVAHRNTTSDSWESPSEIPVAMPLASSPLTGAAQAGLAKHLHLSTETANTPTEFNGSKVIRAPSRSFLVAHRPSAEAPLVIEHRNLLAQPTKSLEAK